MTAQVITLTPQEAERVILRREWKSRKHLDKGHVAWLCEDKLRQTLVLSSKLAMCADFVNLITQDKCDKVSVAGGFMKRPAIIMNPLVPLDGTDALEDLPRAIG
eukprot:4409490-Prymnesium_polylepis.1